MERVRLEPLAEALELGRLEASALPVQESWQDTPWEDLRRVNPDSVVWQCRVCGAQFKQDSALTRLNS
ncbi:hypothetical protein [Deinococcus alpinitundrae]|uniref:hypothetical protein n=1 Tax=Deinococcus alpinitundrae TaxID=468913 RepID=UPI00137A2BD5|nr:hypothetical protein [Deinococcus alpinitundrae]